MSNSSPGSWMDAVLAAAVAQLLAFKKSVRTSESAQRALTGLGTSDGVTLVEGDHVLLTGQTNGAENGPWIASSGGWARRDDGTLLGSALMTREGDARAHVLFLLTNATEPLLGSTPLVYAAVTVPPDAGTYFVLNAGIPSGDVILPVTGLAARISALTSATPRLALGVFGKLALQVDEGTDTVTLFRGADSVLTSDPAITSIQVGAAGDNARLDMQSSGTGQLDITAPSSCSLTVPATLLFSGNNVTVEATTTLSLSCTQIGFEADTMGFFGQSPVVQPTRAGQLTDSTAGTPGGTLAALTGTYATDVAILRNWGASLIAKLNALDTNAHNLGLST